MILILMQSRSGSSLVASIFNAHGFNTAHSKGCKQFGYISYENEAVKQWVRNRKKAIHYRAGEFCKHLPGVEKHIPRNGCVKMGVEYWPLFRPLAPKLFTVSRKPGNILASLLQKNPGTKREWAIGMIARRAELMAEARAEGNGWDVSTDALLSGDFSGLAAGFEHHGLPFNEAKARACVDPSKWHHA